MDRKLLGILGGMGSEAGASLFKAILDHTPARNDQDHLEILLYSNPAIPDRTRSILGSGPSAEPELIRSVKLLESDGVQCIIIGCVTSHYYIETLRAAVSQPILSIVEETAAHIDQRFEGRRRVGVLATTGTIQSGVFQKEFQRRSLETIVLPDEAHQRLVMGAIYGEQGIKAGCIDQRNRGLLLEASRLLVENGADLIVAGCTEIPLVLSGEVFNTPVINTIDVLARSAVSFCHQGSSMDRGN